jgi:hypothetical protein
MVTKKRSGSEGAKTGSGAYLTGERAKQSDEGAFSSKRSPVGSATLFELFLTLRPAGAMSRLSLVPGLGPDHG